MAGPKVETMKKQRGVVILFSIFVVVVMLAFGGLAIDIAAVATDRSELHRATDAASLAGAGKLGFDASVFPTVRDYAVQFGANNPTRFGSVSLNRNDGNAAGGDVVLGIWDGSAGTFTPSLDATYVNAVQCRTTQTVPTTFLGILGVTSMTMTAQSIAVASPPATPPEGVCGFPVGLTDCPWKGAGTYGSQGCGQPISFIDSTSNTGAWVNLSYQNNQASTQTPSASFTRGEVTQAATNNGQLCPVPPAGSTIGVQGGMDQSVYNLLANCNPSDGSNCKGYFIDGYNQGLPSDVYNGPNWTYQGQGWVVYLPILHSPTCPPGNINQPMQVMTYTRMVMTQVINNGWCTVPNGKDSNSMSYCPKNATTPWGTAPRNPSMRAIFGYYSCTKWWANPSGTPAPMAAQATMLRLAQ